MSYTFEFWVLFSDSYVLGVNFLTPLIAGEDLMFIYPCLDVPLGTLKLLCLIMLN